ncbi:MAG: DUF3617 domain-containing protein [Rhodocyclaceae bacterium]|nr:DUF3617 domain-containing protein [Rhodocyclaceae bacterium]
MKKTALALAIALAAPPLLAEGMMKPGLWEVRVVKQIIDGQDMAAQMAAAQAEMQQMLASLPPAQRKQMEQMMGGRAPAGAATTQRICVSPAMASQDKPALPPEARCETTKVTRSGNKLSFEMKCPNMSGKGESIASGDAITTRMDAVMTDERGRHTMQTESQMKYLGPDCQGLKPADQIAKEWQGGARK